MWRQSEATPNYIILQLKKQKHYLFIFPSNLPSSTMANQENKHEQFSVSSPFPSNNLILVCQYCIRSLQ